MDSGSAVLTGITGIAAGSSHSLALRSTGTLLSWGDNAYGQLGNGTTSDRLVPVAVVDGNQQPVGLIGVPGDPTDPTLDSDGDGTRDSQDAFPYDPRYKADTDGDGLPDEWERAQFGNLTATDGSGDADGDGITDRDEFQHGSNPKATLTVARSPIAAGDYHSLGLKVDGTLLAWGYNNYGQLGDGSTTNRSQSVTVKIGGTPRDGPPGGGSQRLAQSGLEGRRYGAGVGL